MRKKKINLVAFFILFLSIGCESNNTDNVNFDNLKIDGQKLDEMFSIDTTINVYQYKTKEKNQVLGKFQYDLTGIQNGEIINYRDKETNPPLFFRSPVKFITSVKNNKLNSWSYNFNENGILGELSYYKDNELVSSISINSEGFVDALHSETTSEYNKSPLSLFLLDSIVRNEFPKNSISELKWEYIKLCSY